MFKFSFYRNIESEIKAWSLKKRIKKFRKTKDCKLIIEKDFNTTPLSLLSCILYLAITMVAILCCVALVGVFVLLILGSITSPSQTSVIVALMVGFLSSAGVVYSAYKKRKDEEKDRFDNSIYLLMQYLIEIERGNYSYKIYKDDLGYMFMNIPNKVLYILRDIQDNIKEIERNKEEIKDDYEKVLHKEVLFLIIYIREYYNIAEAELKHDIEQEEVIKDIITNSSKIKNTSNKKDKPDFKLRKK